MPITLGNILRFKLFQEMQGQQVLNTMHYEVVGGDLPVTDPQLQDLCRGVGTAWYGALRSRQTTALLYLRMEVEVLNTPWFGVYNFPPGSAGASASDPLPIFNATSVQHVRSNKITRHGWTRIPGMTETDNQAGNISSDWRTLVQNWADVLIRDATGVATVSLPLVDSDTVEYGTVAALNIIWGGNSVSFPEGRFQPVSSYDIKTRITTQNTRKIGSGG